METMSKLAKFSIGTTQTAWVLFVAISLVPMSEGGLPAVASLFMDIVFTIIAAADVFGTIALDQQKPGCLSAGYFIGWGLIVVSAAIGTARTVLESHKDIGPGKTDAPIISIIFGVLEQTLAERQDALPAASPVPPIGPRRIISPHASQLLIKCRLLPLPYRASLPPSQRSWS